MDWSEAAAYLFDRTPALSDPPDDPRQDSDYEFFLAVKTLVEGDLFHPQETRETELSENLWVALLHPRGRGGRWIRSSRHAGEEYRGLRVDLSDRLPKRITVGGQVYERDEESHVTMFDSRRVKRAIGDREHSEMKRMADKVADADLRVTSTSDEWRVAEKGDRRALVVPVKVQGADDVYAELSREAGAEVPEPPTHVTVYTAPGKKGIGMALPHEWDEYTRPLTKQERADLDASIRQLPMGGTLKSIQAWDRMAARAHADQTDKKGVPYIEHVRSVADSVQDRDAVGVAYFHDALEDTGMAPADLQDVLDPDQIEAVKLLTRSKDAPYGDYIDKLAKAPGRPGELAREVKVADLQHNLGRLTPDVDPKGTMKKRYTDAIRTLAPERAPVAQRGPVYNRAQLSEQAVEQRFRSMYDAAVAGGHAERDRNWYAEQHELIARQAKEYDVDPTVLAAMVAATSPQNRWIWPEGTPAAGTMPNMEAALLAVEIAREYPDEPAPMLAKRLRAAGMRGEEGPGMLSSSLENAVRLYRGEDPDKVMVAPKTRSFYNNLAWPDRETTTTVDTLMARAAQGETSRAEYKKAAELLIGKGAAGTSGYRWLVERLDNLRRALADEGVHLKPQELQAIIWREQQRRQDADIEAEVARRQAAAAKRRR